MNFLRAEKADHYVTYLEENYKPISKEMFTPDETQQLVRVNMTLEPMVARNYIQFRYSKNTPAPKRFTIKAIQYAEFPVKIILYMSAIGAGKSYERVVITEEEISLEVKPNTKLICIDFVNPHFCDTSVNVRLMATNIEY